MRDFLFSSFFYDENNIDILENFLSCYLEVPLEKLKGKVKLKNRKLPIYHKMNRSIEVDLIVDIDGKKINIELSNSLTKGMSNRNITYACNIHGRQLKYGDNDYSNIKKTLQIQLNNFRCNKDEIIKSYLFKDDTGEVLTEMIQIDIVDMVLASKMCYTIRNEKLIRWLKIFRTTTMKELKELIGDDLMEISAAQKFVEEMNKYSKDEEWIGFSMKLPREELIRNTMIADAKEEGREVEKMKIARNLKKSGIDIKIISENTGLSVEEIEKL